MEHKIWAHTVNDDYHLLKLKIKNGENHTLHDPLRETGCWGKNIKTEDLGKK